MWIMKNSKDLLENIRSRSLSSCNSIKTFDFSTLYTTKHEDKLRELVQLCFLKKNGQRRYKYLVLGRDISYHILLRKTKNNTDSNQKVVIDNIFAMFGGRVFQQIVRYTYGYKLCSSSRRIVPLFV